MPDRLATFSALLLLAASPAHGADAPSAARDSQGNVVRSSSGACVASGSAVAPEPGCVQQRKPLTFRLLQGMVPQPTVSVAPLDGAAALPPAETVQVELAQPWTSGSSLLTPEQRAELYAVLAELEAYWRVEAFAVVAHPGATKDQGHGRWLAERRAGTLAGFLASAGVMQHQITSRVGEPAGAPRVELAVTVRGRR